MKKILFSVGEISGDEHAAQLIRSLSILLAGQVECRGMGGSQLRRAGGITVVDSEASAGVMGFQEVLFSARRIWRSFASMKRALEEWKPDLLVLVDYPDFNLRLAAAAKRLKIPVFYYITPQVWAWRAGRVQMMDRLVDLAAVIFPFEKKFFESRGFKRSFYVGHPFFGRLRKLDSQKAENDYRTEKLFNLGIDPNRPVFALLPGSRRNEIVMNGPTLRAALDLYEKRNNELQIAVPVPEAFSESLKEEIRNIHPCIKVIEGQSLDILRCADAGLLKSGTSNLQAAFYGLPFSMFYKTSPLSAWIVRRVTKVREYSMVNIIRPGSIKEIVQENFTAENIAFEIEDLLQNQEKRRRLKNNLGEVVRLLADADQQALFENCNSASERAAKLAASLLSPAR